MTFWETLIIALGWFVCCCFLLKKKNGKIDLSELLVSLALVKQSLSGTWAFLAGCEQKGETLTSEVMAVWSQCFHIFSSSAKTVHKRWSQLPSCILPNNQQGANLCSVIAQKTMGRENCSGNSLYMVTVFVLFFKTLVLFSVESQTISINLLLSKIANNLVPKCLPVPLRFRKVDGD